MNIFLSSDLISEYFIINELDKLLSNYDLTKCTIMTTDRYYDKKFINYALLNGAEIKIYSFSKYITDNVIEKVAEKIDYLILFSDMSNFFFRKLFEICDKTVIIDGERTQFKSYKNSLYKDYENTIEQLEEKKLIHKVDLLQLYYDLYLTKLKTVKRVPIQIIS